MLNNLSLFLALSASTLVSASPIVTTASQTQAACCTSASSTSQGFRLVAKTTDPFHQLADKVEGTVLEAFHAGVNYRVPILRKPDDQNPGRIFYFDKPPQNSSTALLTDSSATDESNSGPAVSYGLSVQSPTDFIWPEYPQEHGVSFLVGGSNSGTPVSMANMNTPFRGLFVLNDQGSGTFTACNRTIPYYDMRSDITLEYLYNGSDLPDGCVPIRLVPVCADLPAVPPGSLASHEYVQPASCYNNINGTP
ncbi:hypothetical protein SEUCBS139899_010232 [Sporothrix eucalyptigena]|uniref:DUF7907 domain-containing protein n=1 Tax=Sporothrix eucalyptigena TaxID=1812306 RepID=A0ABP0CWY7_9PEZI